MKTNESTVFGKDETFPDDSTRPVLLCMTTIAASAWKLMEGQLAYMRERGFRVVVVSSPGWELDVVAERERVEIVGIPMEREIKPLRDFVSFVHICRLMWEIKPSIVNAGTAKAGFLGMLASWITRIPIRIYTVRGLRFETIKQPSKRFLLRLTEMVAAACATRIICVSDSLRAEYERNGFASAEKLSVLGDGSSNGVDVDRFLSSRSQREEARRAKGIHPDHLVVGFVGRLTKDKGVTDLFAAFRAIRQVDDRVYLLIAGDAESGDPVEEKLFEEMKDHPAILGVGYQIDMVPYYRCFDLVAFPSYREGFPNVPLEAAAAGLPVVGYRATGTVDAVVDGKTGLLVPAGDSTAFAQALMVYLNDPGRRIEDGHRARERVSRHYRRSIVWQNLLNLYREELLRTTGDANVAD